MNNKQLAGSIRELARMALSDGIAYDVFARIHDVSIHVADHQFELARRELRALRVACEKGFTLVSGADTHIALACEAFEKVYGPL